MKFLDFEQPIEELHNKLSEIKQNPYIDADTRAVEMANLEKKINATRKKI